MLDFKTEKHYKDKRNYYVDKDKCQIIENVHEPIISRATPRTCGILIKK